MKIWLKFLIGIILGILAAFILPVSSPQASAVLDFITQIVIRFGRYTILPLLFFAVMSSVTKLRDSKKLLKTGVWSVLVIALSSLILTAVGILSILIIRLPRIPISVEKVTSVTKIDIKGMILQLLPFSSFDVLQEGTFLLPVFLFAGFAGAGCNVDKRSYGFLYRNAFYRHDCRVLLLGRTVSVGIYNGNFYTAYSYVHGRLYCSRFRYLPAYTSISMR